MMGSQVSPPVTSAALPLRSTMIIDLHAALDMAFAGGEFGQRAE
jgi:hypothetical protein